MSLLRASTPALRRGALAHSPAAPTSRMLGNMRGYADKPNSGEFGEAYQRGNPSGFQKKEQAQENQYVRQQEEAKLKALREKLSQQRKHLDDVEAAINDLSGNKK